MLKPAIEWLVRRQIDRADAARQSRDWPIAAAHYRKAARFAPGHLPIWVQLGHALKEAGDLAASETAYRRAAAVAAGSADTDAALHLGHLLRRLERFDEACACYADVIDRSTSGDARIVDAHVGRGDVFRDQRLWKASAVEYSKALALHPQRSPIWIQLGHAMKEAGHSAEAETAYRKALQVDLASADGWTHLGHILRRQRRRSEAVEAYRKALSVDPASTEAAQAALEAVGYAPSELAGNGDDAPARAAIEAFRALSRGLDVIWFGNIEWHFRMQRPQHLASAMAGQGVGVVYVSMLFDSADTPCFRVISHPRDRVLEVRLGFPGGEAADIHQGVPAEAVTGALAALDRIRDVLGIDLPVLVVQEPSWEAVLRAVPRRKLIYDCVDFLAAFDDALPARLESEAHMLSAADVIVAASAGLQERLSDRRPVLIRNGADVQAFRRPPTPRRPGRAVQLGYFGAIREWFAFDWIVHCAERHPDWTFLIVGRPEAAIPPRARRANIEFAGERPFHELPDLLAGFDVALIPFRANALTEATNPVKLYEYLAGGKPVVATALPETKLAGDLVYLAEDAASFERGIVEALAGDNAALAARRVEWAGENGWDRRAGELLAAIEGDPG